MFSVTWQVSWKCSECGYEWDNLIRNRTRNPGCPKCKNDKSKNYE
ncbi:zinc-ribbon domain-containing protein [Butyrivibrio sp.]|nr:hypothetical protein [Butyrivibrio sp.]